ncbi:hypothetical protein M407DRAFT_242695 [Tulasnella calospora MUT 4182]|uniref:BTB domain-containing protein n=1 Tax=Tulasnella calospora MUT 4182 TaxID=1051891 RepID=A0A0C3QDT8_9AGAM|nr:hypothetical protein M407DRAFT_242695 [Tulasnella calospora MUT 4182]
MSDCDKAKSEGELVNEGEPVNAGESVDIHFACTKPIYFQIEETTFAIPKKSLLDSEFFTSLLTSEHLGEPEEGTILNPIKLSGITKADMSGFLMVLESRSWEHPASLNPKQWTAALRLSTMWSFRLVRKYIIHRIEDFPTIYPVMRIELARAYNIPKWLHPMYVELCMRKESLSAEEGTRIGMSTFAALCRIREVIRNHQLRVYEENVARVKTCDHRKPDGRSFAKAPPPLCSQCFRSPGDDITEASILGLVTKAPDLAVPADNEIAV